MKALITCSRMLLLLISVVMLHSQCSKSKNETPPEEEPDPAGPAKLNDTWELYSTIDDMNLHIDVSQWSFAIGDKVYFSRYNRGLYVYDVKSKQLAINGIGFPSNFVNRVEPQLTIHENIVYILGGRSDLNFVLKDAWSFDIANPNVWKRLPDLPIPMKEGHAFVANGKLYAGIAATDPADPASQRRLYTLPLNADKWDDNFIDLKTNAGSVGFSFMINNNFYYGGGKDYTSAALLTKKAYKFNITNSEVSPIAELPFTSEQNGVPYSFKGAGHAYIARHVRHVYYYDHAANKWIEVKEVPVDTKGAQVTHIHNVGDKIFGFTANGVVFEYK